MAIFTEKLRKGSEIKSQSTANWEEKEREGHNIQATKQEGSISSEEHTGKGADLFINQTLYFPPEGA